MQKYEFMDLLRYYFRKCDPDDLKGILEDCEEQFRLGDKRGIPEEETCYQLGSPKNIYRYYMGQPIVRADNAKLNPRYAADANRLAPRGLYDQAAGTGRTSSYRQERYAMDELHVKTANDAVSSPAADGGAAPPERSAMNKAATAVTRSFYAIVGKIFSLLSALLCIALVLSILFAVGIYYIPNYATVLPLPDLQLATMIAVAAAIFLALLITSYVSRRCHKALRQERFR
ncbi:HAAS domain-containing protein [Megasphaera vaginalis (ex Bordigoni et al. 2020)]|uniref:HAAS domain-containing protein n=1 Tax=Megasphaera vaginalis (ex Bordigoni et al. 2020) TaxID=2045301 RepID=UPI000C7CED50|nr:DUF1700 domain-containing protein [Megasphaera vaginalis (ex Bordigoni et al. 2020)]